MRCAVKLTMALTVMAAVGIGAQQGTPTGGAAAQGARTPAEAGQAEGILSQALGRLFAVAENYPQLRANENVKMLQEELSGTENKIGFARQFYNDIATKYNISRETFPTNFIANSFNFQRAELFEITDAGERAVPNVDLSMK